MSLVRAINHLPTQTSVLAEREVLSRLHPGCHAPVGVYAVLDVDRIRISGFVAQMDGGRMIRKGVSGMQGDSMSLANQLADELLNHGAREILEEMGS